MDKHRIRQFQERVRLLIEDVRKAGVPGTLIVGALVLAAADIIDPPINREPLVVVPRVAKAEPPEGS